MSVALLAVFLAAWFEPSVGLEDGLLFPGKLSFVAVFVSFPDPRMEIEFGSP